MEYGCEEMFDSNLTMIDSTPTDLFEFYLREYWCQMVAGTIKVPPDKSIRVYVPVQTQDACCCPCRVWITRRWRGRWQ